MRGHKEGSSTWLPFASSSQAVDDVRSCYEVTLEHSVASANAVVLNVVRVRVNSSTNTAHTNPIFYPATCTDPLATSACQKLICGVSDNQSQCVSLHFPMCHTKNAKLGMQKNHMRFPKQEEMPRCGIKTKCPQTQGPGTQG